MSSTSAWARRAVAHVDAHCQGEPLSRSLRITLNFHPDCVAGGLAILDGLAGGGLYRSQFETGTSNGSLTAHRGGARWRWEQALFGGVYDDAPPAERPKYGALDHRRRPLGGAPRFGSAHLRLREHMLDRSTYCFPDSSLGPTRFATSHRFDLRLLADVLESTHTGSRPDPLDGYIEAQVHGRVCLTEDVEAIVMDPCYRGTSVEEAACRLGVALEWHEGRVLDLPTLDSHVDYRGPAPVWIGHDISREGQIDAAVIGAAVRSGCYETQPLKQLWHLTAQWGHPRA